MRNIFLNILNSLGTQSARTRNITRHVGWSFVYKIGSVVAGFLLIPITLEFLGKENFGVWLVLSSFIAWFSFFDIGLGNGLRNKFAEAKSTGKYLEAQAFVSTAYYTIFCISTTIAILFFILNYFIDWTLVFNTSETLYGQLRLLMPILFGSFAVQLIVNLITTIYQADQHHSIQGKTQFFTQSLSVLAVWILTKTSEGSLLIFGVIVSLIPLAILIGLNIYAFQTMYRAFKPKLSLWKKSYLKEIAGLGLSFFIIQIAALILFSTDTFIIARIFSPEENVPYQVAFKYFSIITMVYTIIITPYWSSFTEAYANKDFEWIKKSVSTIQRLWFLIPIALVVMVLLADWFYVLWVGKEVKVSLLLNISMAFFVLLLTFNMIYVNFINGVGKIRLQLTTSIISMTINIPLSIYFGRTLGWGTSGVILATCFCLLYTIPLWPIQYKKIMNKTATGIWNR